MSVNVIREVSLIIPTEEGEAGEERLVSGRTCISDIDHPSVRIGSIIKESQLEDDRIPGNMRGSITKASLCAMIAGLNALESSDLISEESKWELVSDSFETGILFASSFDDYEMSCEARKKALGVLLHANVQLAQIVKAKGPNFFASNACASTTAAIKLACNMLDSGDAKRMVVIGSDTPLSLRDGEVVDSFVKMKAATTGGMEEVLPFSSKRSGFVFGESAVAFVIERCSVSSSPSQRVEIVASELANSCFHGTRIDTEHLSHVLEKCVLSATKKKGISLPDFAKRCIYVSHETFTPTCFSSEAEAMRKVFGASVTDVRIVATKAMCGHCMGSCVEDAMSYLCLKNQTIPPPIIPNLDPQFSDLNFAAAGEPLRFAIHVALGMGSHVAIVIYGTSEQ